MTRKLLGTLPALVACALFGAGMVACNNPAPETAGGATDSTAAMEQKNADVSRQFIDEVFNKGNMTFLEEHVAPDFVEHNPAPGQKPGIAGFKEVMQMWRAGFPDSKVVVDDVIAKGDLVVIRSTQSGTQSGPFMGMPASNKSFSGVDGIDIVRIKDGKMTEHWGQADMMKMMTQLGIMPLMSGGAAPAGTPPDTMIIPMPTDTTKKKM